MKISLMPSKDKTLAATLGVFVVLVVGLSIAGAFRSYSPVPFWDMWDGYIGFFESVTEGNWSAWLAQHNEHRIFLARLLFFADLKWFGGAIWFLIAANYILVGTSAFIFWRISCDENAAITSGYGRIILGLFITAWLFLWMQQENLAGGFQSQFFLAQLLPLCALYWLHKSVAGVMRGRHFLVACGLGLASVGTMANGILALPLMTFYALLTRQRAARVGILAALSVLTLFFYFQSHHGSHTQALTENPSGLLHFALLYLGNPFYHLFEGGKSGKLIATIAGLALVGGSAWVAIKSLRRPRESTLQLALLFFILYIGGTALGTAVGRLIFGMDQAFNSRYTTPALMAWAALLVLYAPALLAAYATNRKKTLIPFAVIMLLMISTQFKALRAQDEKLFEQKVAALALELRIKDQVQVLHIYPSIDTVLPIAEKASAQNLSIFGMYPFRGAREQFGAPARQLVLPACQGSLDAVEIINGDARFVRVAGRMFNPDGKSYPQVIRFLNDQSKVVGYALTGQPIPNVADASNKKVLQSGYRGYLLSDQMGAALTLRGESQAGPSCQIQANVPVVLLSLTTAKPSAGRAKDIFVKFSDNGVGWGEWPAIAVKKYN